MAPRRRRLLWTAFAPPYGPPLPAPTDRSKPYFYFICGPLAALRLPPRLALEPPLEHACVAPPRGAPAHRLPAASHVDDLRARGNGALCCRPPWAWLRAGTRTSTRAGAAALGALRLFFPPFLRLLCCLCCRESFLPTALCSSPPPPPTWCSCCSCLRPLPPAWPCPRHLAWSPVLLLCNGLSPPSCCSSCSLSC